MFEHPKFTNILLSIAFGKGIEDRDESNHLTDIQWIAAGRVPRYCIAYVAAQVRQHYVATHI